MTPYAPELIEQYKNITTATLTTVLLKMGLRNVWVRGAVPLNNKQGRIVGPAFTLRFVPAREDLSTMEALASPTSTRAAIEAMPDGCIAVMDAGGYTDAGVMGDILCQRMKIRGVTAMITDGTVRDVEGILQTGLKVWSNGVSAPPSPAGLTFVGWQDPIGCGGVAIFPDDLIVADQDGAVVVPRSLVDDVLNIATEQEALEEWILNEVKNGASLPGLYPTNDENRRRFEDSRAPAVKQSGEDKK